MIDAFQLQLNVISFSVVSLVFCVEVSECQSSVDCRDRHRCAHDDLISLLKILSNRSSKAISLTLFVAQTVPRAQNSWCNMRASIRRLAAPATAPFRPGQRPPALALLPPIPLYRRLLRIHRKRLGPEERVFGDTYLKAEFRRHRDVENPLHIVGFLTEWQQYGQQLEGEDWKGQKIDPALLDRLSDQQIGQMHELMLAIQKRGRDSVDDEEEGDILRAIESATKGGNNASS
jgi:hypothetical protein